LAAVKASGKCKAGCHWCPSCRVVAVEHGFSLCFGCERKWWKVYDDCCGAGLPEGIARSKADCAYPGRLLRFGS